MPGLKFCICTRGTFRVTLEYIFLKATKVRSLRALRIKIPKCFSKYNTERQFPFTYTCLGVVNLPKEESDSRQFAQGRKR